MKYLKSDDNRYRVQFMRETEKLMDSLTVAQFIVYLEENAELESDDECEYIGGKVVKCRAYDLKEANSNLHKEFLVTEDGRVFYWRAVNNRIELVDREEAKEADPEEVKDSGSEKLIDSALVYKEQSGVRFQKRQYQARRVAEIKRIENSSERYKALVEFIKPEHKDSFRWNVESIADIANMYIESENYLEFTGDSDEFALGQVSALKTLLVENGWGFVVGLL